MNGSVKENKMMGSLPIVNHKPEREGGQGEQTLSIQYAVKQLIDNTAGQYVGLFYVYTVLSCICDISNW